MATDYNGNNEANRKSLIHHCAAYYSILLNRRCHRIHITLSNDRNGTYGKWQLINSNDSASFERVERKRLKWLRIITLLHWQLLPCIFCLRHFGSHRYLRFPRIYHRQQRKSRRVASNNGSRCAFPWSSCGNHVVLDLSTRSTFWTATLFCCWFFLAWLSFVRDFRFMRFMESGFWIFNSIYHS